MRRAAFVTVLAGLLTTVAGCADDSPAVPPPTVATATVTATAAPVNDGPTADLVGVWGRTTDTMEVMIRFLPDGRYRSVEIYTPLEAGGIYTLQRVEDGRADITDGRIRLVGSTATVKRTATDDTAGDYEKPTETRTGTYRWELADGELHLTDAEGTDAVFTRQQ